MIEAYSVVRLDGHKGDEIQIRGGEKNDRQGRK